jgi:hypothetical protein
MPPEAHRGDRLAGVDRDEATRSGQLTHASLDIRYCAAFIRARYFCALGPLPAVTPPGVVVDARSAASRQVGDPAGRFGAGVLGRRVPMPHIFGRRGPDCPSGAIQRIRVVADMPGPARQETGADPEPLRPDQQARIAAHGLAHAMRLRGACRAGPAQSRRGALAGRLAHGIWPALA